MLRLEKRAGGKVVTVVEGLDPKASDLEGLLKRLRSRCAAGGKVQNGKIEVQGDHRPVVGELLSNEGYAHVRTGHDTDVQRPVSR